MPLQKTRKKREPKWKEWDQLAQKEGLRAPITSVNGDIYTGEWKDNKKHGELVAEVSRETEQLQRIIQARVLRCGREMVIFTTETGRME